MLVPSVGSDLRGRLLPGRVGDALHDLPQLLGRHDLSVLFDDDLGKIFLIHGNSAPYPIEELAPDLKSFVAGPPKRSLPERMGEGHHLYKINGKYVDVSAIPGGPLEAISMTRFSGPLPLGQSLLVVMPHIISLLAVTVICFAVSYAVFMRQEVRSL